MANPQIAPDGHTPDWPNSQLFNGFIPGTVLSFVIYLLARPHMQIMPALALAAVPAILYEVYYCGYASIESISSARLRCCRLRLGC